ncbi:MAG: ROK family protein [Bacteroidales bacterium]|nr:ROK family protein [Bacteroidales bacterium]
MYKYATAIGIDIGRTMIRAEIVRYDGIIIDSKTFPYKEHPDRDILLANILESIKLTRADCLKHKVNPLCVGIAAKGFIDYKKGVVLGPDQGFQNWTNVQLSKIVSKESGLPVYVDNDANLMALAETTFGTASGKKDILFMTLRSGIGGAIFIGGKLFRGKNNSAGEFGQMSIEMDGPESETGIPGSLEHYAASASMVKHYKSLIGETDDQGEESIRTFRAIDVFNLSYQNDQNAKIAVERNAEFIGVGLANLISVFSPEIIVLGGGMSLARDSYLDLIREHAYKRSIGFCNKEVIIERASLGHSGATMGASYFALTQLDGRSI